MSPLITSMSLPSKTISFSWTIKSKLSPEAAGAAAAAATVVALSVVSALFAVGAVAGAAVVVVMSGTGVAERSRSQGGRAVEPVEPGAATA